VKLEASVSAELPLAAPRADSPSASASPASAATAVPSSSTPVPFSGTPVPASSTAVPPSGIPVPSSTTTVPLSTTASNTAVPRGIAPSTAAEARATARTPVPSKAKTVLKDGREVQTCDSLLQLEAAAVREVVAAAKAAITEKDAFSLALSEAALLASLAEEPGLDLAKFHIYFCDDTAGLASVAWLDKVPKEQVHAMPADMEPQLAAACYTASICGQPEDIVGDSELGLPALDLVLLRVGSDGRCAGILPGSDFAKPANGQVVLFGEVAPRVALSLDTMNAARCAVLMAGPGASSVVESALGGKVGLECPAGLVRAERTLWLVVGTSYSVP